MNLFKPDIHSMIHFVGCYALVPTIMAFGQNVLQASVIALVLGLLWEIADEANGALKARGAKTAFFLDPRGGDILDLVFDTLGVVLAYMVFR